MRHANRVWNVGCIALLLLAAEGLARADATRRIPAPGTVNYVEGQVTMNGQNLSTGSTPGAQLDSGQVLNTGQGEAELLLTPGVFLRVGDHSEIRMIAPGLADTRVTLLKGSALVEADQLFPENNLSVVFGNATTRIEKKGLYAFNADRPAVSVLDGKATVLQGDSNVTVKKGHQVLLAEGQPLKAQHFDKESLEAGSLYRWSKLRSQYVAEANMDAARTVVVRGGWYGPGWYWDPYWDFYSFLPGSGVLYSPFGWGYYSPAWVGYTPLYYRYPAFTGHGFRGRAFVGNSLGGARGLGRHVGHR